MSKETEIRELIRKIAKNSQVMLFNADVKSVEGATCTVVYDGLELSGVRLTPGNDDSETKLIVTPRLNSLVTVIDETGDLRDLAVFRWSEIESISTNIESLIYNGGDNGGLCIVPELQTQLEKMTARIDGIINALNAGTASTGTPDSGAALITSIKTVLATIIDVEDFSGIENETIKH